MKVLVTGATGFVGQHVARRLAASADVAIFARHRDKARAMFGDAVEVRHGDLKDAASLDRALEGIDRVYHIAARRDHWGMPYDDYYQANVVGTRSLLEAARRHGTSKIVYCSSVGVYGHGYQYFPVDEAHPFGQHLSFYHKSKALAEEVVRSYPDLPVVTVRPGWIYGPNDEWGGVTQMLIKLAKGQFAFVGSGENRLHPVFINDVVGGIVAAGESERYGEAYLLLGPEHTTFRNYVYAMCDALGAERPRWSVPYLAGRAACYALEPMWLVKNRVLGKKLLGDKPPMTRDTLDGVSTHRYFDTSKATREIAHTPAVSIADGLQTTVEWLAGTGRLPASVTERIKQRGVVTA
ncbi:MAG: NAD-dependent epimerase/dehydratase family protein [Dehalococcoidia bacterium]